MRTLTVAAGAVLVVGASAMADPFVLSHLAIRQEKSLMPSSGSFITQFATPGGENAYLNEHNITVVTAPAVWRNELEFVMTSTWLGVDPYGPKGRYGADPYGTGWAAYVSSARGVLHVPEFTFSLAANNSGLAVNGTLGDSVDGDGLAPAFRGGGAGFVWGPSQFDSFQARSQPTTINGHDVDSLFVGHFVLTDPGAILISPVLQVGFSNVSPGNEAGTVNFVPIDGSPGHQVYPVNSNDPIPFRFESERTTFTTSFGTFTAIDLYIVSTGAYPDVTPAPPGGDDETGDTGDDGGDDSTTPPPTPPDLPSNPPAPPAPPAPPKESFELGDIAIALRAGDTSEGTVLAMLEGAGFHSSRYSAKEWKTLMTGFYDHRIAPTFSPPPSKAERKATLAILFATYALPGESSLTDTGTQDANGDGDVNFADVARILEVGDATPDRLAAALNLLGMDPAEVPNQKAWKHTVKAMYETHILPEFANDRSKKEQQRDRKLLINAR